MFYIRTLIVILLLLPVVEAHAADWQYTGGTDDVSTFFDADGVQYPDKDTVRAWIKSIAYKTSDNYYKEIEGKRKEKFIENTAQKKARGYIPKFFLLDSVKRMYRGKSEYESAIAGAITDEIIANEVDVNSAAKALFEIDCHGKRIAIFSITKYRGDGSVEKSVSTKQPKYDDILPDTTGEWLSMLVCPKATYIF
jgi:hypothetical protein